MNLFPSRQDKVVFQSTAIDLFDQLSKVISPKTNRLILRYEKPFYGSVQFPSAVFRPSHKWDGWVWARAQVRPSADELSSSMEIVIEPSRLLKITIISISVLLVLALSTCIFLISQESSNKGWPIPFSLLLMLILVWQSLYNDFHTTCAGVTGLLIKLQHQDSIHAA